MKKNSSLQILIFLSFMITPLQAELQTPAIPVPAPDLSASCKLDTAQATFKDGQLNVTTGNISRTWTWTRKGLVTTAINNTQTDQTYAKPTPDYPSDWSLPGLIDDETDAELISVTAHLSDDEGFSSQHIEVVSTIRYQTQKLEIQHIVWIFPGAPGLRTQLRIKGLDGFSLGKARTVDQDYKSYGSTQKRPGARTDYLPLDMTLNNSRRYWGYYNDPGNRLPAHTPMLKETVVTGFPVFQNEVNSWASGEAVFYKNHGITVVKESPKTVNQPAHETGSFFTSPAGIAVTGWGISPEEITTDRFRECWATWSIVFTDGNDGMQRALKRFDATRYPVDLQRDAIVLSNTWGAANPGGSQFTEEKYVLQEIEAVGKLGIDVMQIDDGWQKSGDGPGAKNFTPKYPDGWKKIKSAAEHANVKMGLWVAIRNASMGELKSNLDDLGFISWKVDFDNLSSRADYEDRISKYRTLMKHSWGNTQFALCPEYDDPRYGWYFAREYGSIFFQNIQEAEPIHLTMVPFQVLRQHWHMAKYFPSNKLQVMLQNPKRTRKDVSDAYQHDHDYCFAMGLPFVPNFFQSAQFLDDEGTQQLKKLIAVYKKSRSDVFTSTTYPIGAEPSNASWTGFQMVSTTRKNTGHLLLFRELHNKRTTANVQLKFLVNQQLTLTNLLTGEKITTQTDATGKASFTIENPADFRFFHYEVKK